MSSIQRLVYALLLVVAACAGAASTAAADSIVFLKGGDVWLTSPDGTRQYQVTFDGGWDSPSQADDGTIVAVHGSMVVRLDRSGRVLGTPVRAVGGETSALLSDKFKLFGPFDAEVSPDGRRVAYWGTAYNPNSTATDVYAEFRDVTVVMPVDRAEVGPDSWVTSVRTPSWIGSDHLLVAGSGLTNYSFETWEPGAGDDRLQWWFRYVHAIESDAELSPDGRRLVAVAQTNGAASAKDTLHFFSVAGPAWTAPPYPGTWLDDAPRPPAGEARCQGVRDSEVVNPTWSPRSDAVAFEDRDGIWTVAVPDIATSCDGMATTLLAPGGSHPDWGPAD
ncbi:MAG: hypothetical protein HZB46_13015, partial [Solirubrobacterales bacterium]|nr:hypothetical protein [Solirubrobacterales bacterium]